MPHKTIYYLIYPWAIANGISNDSNDSYKTSSLVAACGTGQNVGGLRERPGVVGREGFDHLSNSTWEEK